MSNCSCSGCLHRNKARQCTEILEIAEDLNRDERQVLLGVAQGLLRGRDVYGPLNAATEKRDMPKEALEEIRDALVYVGVKLVQLERQ